MLKKAWKWRNHIPKMLAIGQKSCGNTSSLEKKQHLQQIHDDDNDSKSGRVTMEMY